MSSLFRDGFNPSVLLLAFTLAAAACSGSSSPAAPSQSAFVARPAGSWAGQTAIGTCSSDTLATGIAADVCVSVGALPITARFDQTGDSIAGVVTYQGVPSTVQGTVNGRVVRLAGGFGDDPQAARFEIRDWRTEFVGADEMSGTFTLNVTVARQGVPTTASMTILVSKLRRAAA